jgi:hypothetical protein
MLLRRSTSSLERIPLVRWEYSFELALNEFFQKDNAPHNTPGIPNNALALNEFFQKDTPCALGV